MIEKPTREENTLNLIAVNTTAKVNKVYVIPGIFLSINQ